MNDNYDVPNASQFMIPKTQARIAKNQLNKNHVAEQMLWRIPKSVSFLLYKMFPFHEKKKHATTFITGLQFITIFLTGIIQ